MPREKVRYQWSYETLAELTGLSVNAIEQAKSRREFDPLDFGTLLPFLMRKAKWPIRLAMLKYGLGEVEDNPLMRKPRRRADRSTWKKS